MDKESQEQFEFEEQPRPVFVISIFLIVISVITVLAWFLGQHNPETQRLVAANPIPRWGQNLITLIGVICNNIAAGLMLRGKKLGRHLYLLWGTTALLIGIFTSPNKILLLPPGLAHTIIVYYLMRYDVKEYFLKNG